MSEAVKNTPLTEIHKELGAKMVEFAGWSMPIQYQGIRQEHLHTRSSLGLFDVSHMGEIRVRGRDSLKTLQWLTTNDVSRLEAGQAQYSLFPNEQGGVVDDLIVYCLEPGQDYLLCVNASNTEKDFKFLTENNRGAVIEDQSMDWGQIAIQGPQALAAISKVTGLDIENCPSFEFMPWQWQGQTSYVARTGYTGEEGAEIFVPWGQTARLWQLFMACEGAEPIGLGARDTLRTEMKYPLYGQEIIDSSNPYEAGLGWVVKPDKGDFLGRSEMLAVKEKGLSRKLVGLKVTGKGIARPSYPVFSIDSKEMGVVTSGTLSPSLNQAIAIAYMDRRHCEVGTPVLIQMRNKMIEAEVVKTPFYKRS